MNAEFQRIPRRDKKDFLSDQCKETEENNRMGKTRDLFKKLRAIERTFHAKMGSIKDRNGMDLIEAEDIKKRLQEYTELCKKNLHDPDNHDGVITHPEPDILEKNIYFCFIDYAKAFDCVDHSRLWKILKEMGIPDHLTCLLRNLCLGHGSTVRIMHGTTDWFPNIERSTSRLYIVTLLI